MASWLVVSWPEWILADNLPVRMQLQLHKLLWKRRAGALKHDGGKRPGGHLIWRPRLHDRTGDGEGRGLYAAYPEF